LLLFTLPTVACYQRWQRSSAAVNMTSVWKRSMYHYRLLRTFTCQLVC